MWRSRQGAVRRNRRQEKQPTDRHEQNRRDLTEDRQIETYRKADQRDEQADRREGQRETAGQSQGTGAMLGRCRPKCDRHEGKRAGRQDRERTRQKGEDGGACHERPPSVERNRASIDAELVSPTERPVSRDPS